MSNLIAILVVVAAVGMLIGYQLGYSAGQKAGYDRGHHDGKHAGSVRAFAVGYDRGRHDREVQHQEAEEGPGAGPLTWRRLVGLIVLAGCLLALLLIMRGSSLDFPSLFGG